MKKFWNLMLAALVIMGAVACTENENVEAQPEQKSGLSFEATIDLGETRADVVFNEGTEKWETVWTGNETLTVKHGYASFYQFKNSVEDKNHFVCTDNNAENLIGQSVEIFLTHDAEYNTLNSKAGKAGGNIKATVDSFDPAKGVTLEVKSAFLRYSSEYDVTLDASAQIFDYNGQARTTITLPAGEDVWVAIHTASKVTLSYSINGEKCKEKVLDLEAKKIYNLGILAPIYNVYVLPQPKSAISKWTTFNLYTWGENGVNNTWPGVDITANTKEINGYTYYAYQYPTEFVGQTVNVIVNNGTSQTNDIKLGELNTDYYVVVNSLTEWTVYTTAPAAGSVPEAKLVEDPKPNTVSVYLTTDWDWGTFKLYGFGGTGNWSTFNSWDNCPASYNQVIDGVTYKAWDIPASCVGKSGTQIIVKGTNGSQTADFPITFEAGKDVFIKLEWKEVKNGSIAVIDSPYTE